MARVVIGPREECTAAVLLIEHIVQLLPKPLHLYLKTSAAASLDQRHSSLKRVTVNAEF